MQSSAWLATRKSTKRSVESSANASTSSVAATADIESPLGDSMSTARRLPRDTPALSMLSKRLTMLASKGCVSRGSSALKRIALAEILTDRQRRDPIATPLSIFASRESAARLA